MNEKQSSNDNKWCDLVHVTVQDSEDECVIEYHLNNFASVRELKQKFEDDFKIPVNDQVWIINGLIPNDSEIISELKTADESFYLYITDSLSQIRKSLEVTSEEPDETVGWTCFCTCINEPLKNVCDACGSRKSSSDDYVLNFLQLVRLKRKFKTNYKPQ